MDHVHEEKWVYVFQIIVEEVTHW